MTCEHCKRASRKKHPDIHFIEPEGAHGYLIAQIREVVADASLAPIQASKKVYILDRADLLGIQPANAFLKTLEEPPENVVFILLARMKDAVLPTILSRCQVVPFRHIPSSEAAGIVSQATGASASQARIAIEACDGSITRAITFYKSPEKVSFRRRILEILNMLPLSDERDVLEYAAELVQSCKAWVDVVQSKQAEELNASEDFLSKAALKQIEARNKRALTKTSIESLRQINSIIRSWLRDVLMIKSHVPEQVVNIDVLDSLNTAANRVSEAGLLRAIEQTHRCEKAIAYNVSTETCLDTLLFTIREVFYGSGSSH
jgi:DNA polymerase-3 subunit delta'